MSDDLHAEADVGNAGSAKQVRNASRAEARRRTRELADLAAMLNLAQGRRVLWRLLEKAGLFETPFAGDTNLTNYNIGRQDVGRFLLAEITEAKPDAYITMMLEAKGAQ